MFEKGKPIEEIILKSKKAPTIDNAKNLKRYSLNATLKDFLQQMQKKVPINLINRV